MFDGYDSGPSTKDNADMTEVHFMGSTTMNAKKDMFLSNKKNIIFLLSRSLEQMVAK